MKVAQEDTRLRQIFICNNKKIDPGFDVSK